MAQAVAVADRAIQVMHRSRRVELVFEFPSIKVTTGGYCYE
ncbi:hypothetical protein [Stieleria mannarensis]|nr:hypothetical protein [Rhodopirellula sp. JC639]